MLALYRELLELRRTDPVLTRAGRDALEAEAHGAVLVVRRWVGDNVRVLVANLGDAPVASPVDGTVLLASARLELSELPPWSAAIVEPNQEI